MSTKKKKQGKNAQQIEGATPKGLIPGSSKLGVELLADLKPWPGNPRDNDDSVEDVANSILAHGFLAPIVVWPDEKGKLMIVAGHVRAKAAKKLGLLKVPVAIAKDLTRYQAESYALSDNKTAEKAAWNLELLQGALKKIGVDAPPPGFRAEEIQAILSGQLNLRPHDKDKKKESVLASLEKTVRCPKCKHKFKV